jgi:hypothetical protein
MSLTNNGGGTVTIGVSGSLGGGGASGTNGTSGTSLALTIQKGGLSIASIQHITLSGSIFLDVSGSGGAVLRVTEGGGAPIIVNGFVSSSQQIEDYDVFAVKDGANRFIGNQEITGSLISTATITTNDLFVANSPNFAVPQGNVIIGGSGSRIAFLPTSSLTATAANDAVNTDPDTATVTSNVVPSPLVKVIILTFADAVTTELPVIAEVAYDEVAAIKEFTLLFNELLVAKNEDDKAPIDALSDDVAAANSASVANVASKDELNASKLSTLPLIELLNVLNEDVVTKLPVSIVPPPPFKANDAVKA